MANELKHDDAGVELTRTEDNAITRHAANSQATDDMLRAQSATVWERFAVAASRIIGRKSSGTTTAMTGAEAMEVLSGQAGAAFDMNSQKITSVATPASSGDALIKGTRVTISELPTLTTDKYWTGSAGVPTEASVPIKIVFTELAGQEAQAPSADNTWTDWDISVIVPAEALYVEISAENYSAFQVLLGVRKNGSALDRRAIAGDRGGLHITSEMDGSRIIEIYASAQFGFADFGVKGYWR